MTNIFPRIKTKKHFLLLSVLSGIMMGTSYIPFPAWAIFFCFVPLWLGLVKSEESQMSYKFVFFNVWICQFIFSIIGFNWIYFTAREFGYLPIPVAILTLIAFASFAHLYFPLAGLLAVGLKRRFNLSTLPFILIIALLFSLGERLWPSLFPWNLAYPLLWMKWPLYQWADTVGFFGLSTYILIFQALLTFTIVVFQKSKKTGFNFLISNLVGLALLMVTGHFKQQNWTATNESVSFTLTQGNISNEDKLNAEFKQKSVPEMADIYFNEYERFVKFQYQNDVTKPTDIVLWPETALQFPLDQYLSNRPLNQKLQQKVSEWNTVLITGGFSVDAVKKDLLGYPLFRNSIFFFGPQGEQAPPYYKSLLLAYGEYMPFGDYFPFLYKLLPFVGTYDRGPGPVIKTVQIAGPKKINLGPQICYESLEPWFSQKLALKGSDILINVTNDSWFGDWAEPYQNMIMTFARAIETRRPLVRATNTGISSVMLASGELLTTSPIGRIWTNTYDVKYLKSAPQTWYTRVGHWDWILIVLALVYLIFGSSRVKSK